jgi:hypothetical protein
VKDTDTRIIRLPLLQALLTGGQSGADR